MVFFIFILTLHQNSSINYHSYCYVLNLSKTCSMLYSFVWYKKNQHSLSSIVVSFFIFLKLHFPKFYWLVFFHDDGTVFLKVSLDSKGLCCCLSGMMEWLGVSFRFGNLKLLVVFLMLMVGVPLIQQWTFCLWLLFSVAEGFSCSKC